MITERWSVDTEVRRWPIGWRVALPMVTVSLCIAVRLQVELPLFLLLFAVTGSAVAGGLRSGLFASGLAAFAGAWFFLEPVGTLAVVDPMDQLRLVTLSLLGILVSLLAEGLHRSRGRAEELAAASRAGESRYRAFFELAAVGTATADPYTARVLDCNQKLCEITGYSRDELLGMTFVEITHPEDREQGRDSMDRLVRGEIGAFEAEKRYVRKDGSTVWVQIAVALVRDARGRPLHTVAVAQDVTERRQAEEALLEADRRKDEFLAMLAHELRNPLAPVLSAVQALKQHGPATPALQRQRDLIERQVEHMRRLLDDLLDVSRITRGKVQLQKRPLELAAVVHHAVEASAPLLESRGHRLAVALPAEPVWLEADPTRLAQVLTNLLNNAAKFTDLGGRIELAAERQGGEVAIAVADDGVGMTPEVLARAFDLFAQGDRSLDRSQGGLGIGLTLVRHLVEMHGGSVAAASEGPGRGSRFTVRLPALEGASGTGPEAAGEGPGAAPRRRVLVVDDNVDAAESLALLLELEGHEVRAVHDGPAALEAVRAFAPQVVLLDLGLPGMDGYEVARRLRREEEGAGQRVLLVALTGYGQEEDRRRSQQAGFDHHLVKPVDFAVLRALLASA